METKSLLGIQIRIINNMILRIMDNSPVTKQVKNMTCTNALMIAYIAEKNDMGEDVMQKDIEEKFGITRSTVSKVINLMEDKGLVERHNVEHDARLKCLVLTDKAKQLASDMREDVFNMENKLTRGFSTEELEQLSVFFERMKKNLGY